MLEIYVLTNGLSLGCSKIHPGYIHDLTMFQRSTQFHCLNNETRLDESSVFDCVPSGPWIRLLLKVGGWQGQSTVSWGHNKTEEDNHQRISICFRDYWEWKHFIWPNRNKKLRCMAMYAADCIVEREALEWVSFWFQNVHGALEMHIVH